MIGHVLFWAGMGSLRGELDLKKQVFPQTVALHRDMKHLVHNTFLPRGMR